MRDESGNVLFFIMVGVLLYAALSFVMTKSENRNSLDTQTTYTKANEFILYANEIKQAVANVRVKNGCTIEQISFDRAPFDGSYFSGNYYNPKSPTDFRCHIFHTDGGNVEDKNSYFINSMHFDSIAYGFGSAIGGIGISNCGDTSCTEMYIMGIARQVRDEDYCDQYNKILGNDGLVPRQSFNSVIGFTGWKGDITATLQSSNPLFNGLRAFCHEYNALGDRDFYVFVLIER